MVHAPVLQAAVIAVIDRFLLVVDVLTGVHRPRPAMQQTGTGSDSTGPVPYPNFFPDIPLFSRQRCRWCIGYQQNLNP